MVLLKAPCLAVPSGTRLMSLATPKDEAAWVRTGTMRGSVISPGQSSGNEGPRQTGVTRDRFGIWPIDTAGLMESIWTFCGFFDLCAARSLAASGTEMT